MVAHHDQPVDFDPETHTLIRQKVQRLIRKGWFHTQDSADLEQDLTRHLFDRRGAFDPERAPWRAFVHLVLRCYAANLARHRRAAKRDPRRLRLLHERADRLLADQARRHRQEDGEPPRSAEEQTDLALDVRTVLEQLPPKQRELLQQLLANKTIVQIARERGVARTTLQAMFRRVATQLQRSGLRHYLR